MRFSLNIDIKDVFFKNLSLFNNQLLSTILIICTFFACDNNSDETPDPKSADAMMNDTSKPCDCPDDVDYVCSSLWVTFKNPCYLECAGESLMSYGECMADDCSVACNSAVFVCGVDGQTYESYTCATFCNGVEVAHEGECMQN